jgi:FKBP-type peptidyl-prolyl cis-trans isomerase
MININNSNRRDLLKIPVNVLGLTLLPKLAYASEEDNEGLWTNHNGAFNEDFFKDFTKTETGLLYKDVLVGKGKIPNNGDAVTIKMVGYIYETGEKWTNSYKGIPTYESVVRAGVRENQKIMKGLNEGVKTMKKGGKRILVIPAYLAYNYITIFSEKNPNVIIIPGGSSLVCYIEVLDFKPLN